VRDGNFSEENKEVEEAMIKYLNNLTMTP